MIYKVNGELLASCKDNEKHGLASVYALNGDEVFSNVINLRVMEYNTGGWYSGEGTVVPSQYEQLYYDLQSGMIADNDPDLLFLCEYRDMMNADTTALSMLQQYFPYINVWNGGDTYMGHAICSKFPIANPVHHAYSNSNSRYYDTIEVNINGVVFELCVTHTNSGQYEQSERMVQVGELVEYLNSVSKPWICCGDFNTLYCKDTSGIDYPIIESLLDAGFNVSNCSNFGFMLTYYGGDNDESWSGCLDNIVTKSDIQILGVYVDETKLPSMPARIDHLPIISEIRYTIES